MENVLMGVTMFAAALFFAVVVLLLQRSATKDALDRAHREIGDLTKALVKSKDSLRNAQDTIDVAAKNVGSRNAELTKLQTIKFKADKHISALEAELSVTKAKLDTANKRLADATKKTPAPKKAPAKKPAAKKPAAKKAPAKKTTTKKSR